MKIFSLSEDLYTGQSTRKEESRRTGPLARLGLSLLFAATAAVGMSACDAPSDDLELTDDRVEENCPVDTPQGGGGSSDCELLCDSFAPGQCYLVYPQCDS
ncbi:MAG: hypothetical protein K0V04_23375 [Deltaproteobacteria bacterium]|nr:hypothetical protein [Deltaproteobacteria bacterium]